MQRRAMVAALARLLQHKPRFWGDSRGAAVVEFALIAPMLIGMYFMSVEAGSAIEIKRKMSRAAAMIGNITAQQESVARVDLDDIITIGQATLQPYSRGDAADVVVTGIQMSVDNPPKPTVAWSYAKGKKGAYTKGGPISVPTELLSAGRFLVLVDAELVYVPVIAWSAGREKAAGVGAAFSGITMEETHYEAPRYTEVRCKDC